VDKRNYKGILDGGQLPNPQDVAIPEDIGDFLEDWVESTESQLEELEGVILSFENGQNRDQDAAEIRRILHKIKGESGMVGLDDIASFVHEVENAFEELNADECPDMLLRFKDWTIAAMNSLGATH